jgi:hypothetical protein
LAPGSSRDRLGQAGDGTDFEKVEHVFGYEKKKGKVMKWKGRGNGRKE